MATVSIGKRLAIPREHQQFFFMVGLGAAAVLAHAAISTPRRTVSCCLTSAAAPAAAPLASEPDVGLSTNSTDKLAGDIEILRKYLGIENWIAHINRSFAEIRPDMEMVTGGPNPFIIENGNEFVIKNLAINSQVKIFNISGILVRRLSSDRGTVQGSRAIWDGKDETGTSVPSGIYIFLVYNEQGQTGTGKIAVLRP